MRVESFAIMNISSKVALLLLNKAGTAKLQRTIREFQHLVRTESTHWLDNHSTDTLPYFNVVRVIEGIRFSSVMSYSPADHSLYYAISISCANEDENAASWLAYVL